MTVVFLRHAEQREVSPIKNTELHSTRHPHLSAPNSAHLIELMSWFNNKDELERWAGPNFRYPFTLESFSEDLKLKSLDSFSMLSSKDVLLGFGQCYERLGCCHLGRLAISPAERGKKLVGELINKLLDYGGQKYQSSECSLFVLEDNLGALRAYQRLGFTVCDYPEQMPIDNCLYMRKGI